MIYLMVAIIKENIRMRGLNLGGEKTGFNQCLDQNVRKEGLNKVQTLIKHCSMGQMQKLQRPRGVELEPSRFFHKW
jgi:hypothetical protein